MLSNNRPAGIGSYLNGSHIPLNPGMEGFLRQKGRLLLLGLSRMGLVRNAEYLSHVREEERRRPIGADVIKLSDSGAMPCELQFSHSIRYRWQGCQQRVGVWMVRGFENPLDWAGLDNVALANDEHAATEQRSGRARRQR